MGSAEAPAIPARGHNEAAGETKSAAKPGETAVGILDDSSDEEGEENEQIGRDDVVVRNLNPPLKSQSYRHWAAQDVVRM